MPSAPGRAMLNDRRHEKECQEGKQVIRNAADIRVQDEHQAHGERQHMGSTQGQQHLALQADGEPVCNAEQPVDGLHAGRQIGRLLRREQRAFADFDLPGVAPGIAAEFGAVFEDQSVLVRQFRASRLVPVLGEPAAVERLEALGRSTIRPVTRAHDVEYEVAFIIDEHLPVRADNRRVTGHHVVVMKLDDLCRAAKLIR